MKTTIVSTLGAFAMMVTPTMAGDNQKSPLQEGLAKLQESTSRLACQLDLSQQRRQPWQNAAPHQAKKPARQRI